MRCVSSIFEHPPQAPFHVIVSDNASVDGSPDRMAALHSAVDLLRNETNGGLCKAFNRALPRATGQYVLSLDNDTRLLPGALDRLIAFLETIRTLAPREGGCCPDMTLHAQREGDRARGMPVWPPAVLTMLFS